MAIEPVMLAWPAMDIQEPNTNAKAEMIAKAGIAAVQSLLTNGAPSSRRVSLPESYPGQKLGHVRPQVLVAANSVASLHVLVPRSAGMLGFTALGSGSTWRTACSRS